MKSPFINGLALLLLVITTGGCGARLVDVSVVGQEALSDSPAMGLAAGAPVITNAGAGCADGFCIWAIASNMDPAVSVEIRTADNSTVLGTYSGQDLSYSVTSLTLRLRSDVEMYHFATSGLKMYVLSGSGLRSNGYAIKTNSPPPALPPAPVIDNAGYGCADNLCIWMLAHNISPADTVELRTSDGATVLNTYVSPDLVYTVGSGFTLRLKTQQERDYFSTTGVKAYISAPSGLRSQGYLVMGKVAAPPPPPSPPAVIDNAGYGCADSNCIWILAHGIHSTDTVELRTPDDVSVLGTYASPDLVYTAGSGFSLGLKTTQEKNLFSSSGLKVYVVSETGVRSQGRLVMGRQTLYYGYFGASAGSHLETADHTNLVMTGGWGDWSTPAGRQDITTWAIQVLKESRDRGVTSAMFTIDYLIFDSGYHYRGTGELTQALSQLRAAGVLDMVVAFYPVDEPNNQGLSAQTITQVNTEIRAAAAAFDEVKYAKLAVIYSDNGKWPGITSYDWVGYDNYGRGVLKAPVTGNQKLIIIPGGADPWRESADQFYQASITDSRVGLLMPFVWFDLVGGDHGIRSNGKAPEYRNIGCKITGRCASH